MVRCADGDDAACDAVILTVPLPLLKEIALPQAEREAAAAADIGFGNVIKLLLRFNTPLVGRNAALADMTFMISDQRIPVWWTQHPSDLPCSPDGSAGRKRRRWPVSPSRN